MKGPLAAAEKLVGGRRAAAIVVLLADAAPTRAVLARLEDLFPKNRLDLEVRTWEDLALFHNQVVALFRRELHVITLIVSVIVILSIANTMTMSIFERTREFGTLRAMGARPRRIVGLLLLEGTFLGLAGAAAGLLRGAPLARGLRAGRVAHPL